VPTTTATHRALIGSLALNGILAVAAVHSVLERGDARADPSPAAPEHGEQLAQAGEPQGQIGQLRALGLSEEQTMPLVLASLTSGIDGAPLAAAEFWRSDWTSMSPEALRTREERLEAVRTALIDTYGPEAESAQPLRALFRPLESRYPFLSPGEQRAIVRSVASRRMPRSHGEFMASLPSELSPTGAFEFALRESPLAMRIRAAQADLTEAEFRALFAKMAEAERTGTALRPESLGSAVPSTKAMKVLSRGDPAWDALRTAATSVPIAERQLWAVYEVLRDSNESLRRVRPGESPPSPAALAAKSRDRHVRIAGLVGEPAAAVLIKTVDEMYRSMPRAPPPLP
jgi:hypothetical protein